MEKNRWPLRQQRDCGVADDRHVTHTAEDLHTAEQVGNETRRELLALDQRAFGVDRARLINLLIDNSCAAPVIFREKDRQLSGYALARRGTDADYIGPVITTETEQATGLLDGVLAQLIGRRIYIDLNSAFEMGAKVLAERGLTKQRDLIRMSYGARNQTDSRFVFAIAGPEVG